MPHALLVTIPGGSHESAGGCLSAQATAFKLAGKPANQAAWTACAHTLTHQYSAFPPAP